MAPIEGRQIDEWLLAGVDCDPVEGGSRAAGIGEPRGALTSHWQVELSGA
jgi:hypothetical protein